MTVAVDPPKVTSTMSTGAPPSGCAPVSSGAYHRRRCYAASNATTSLRAENGTTAETRSSRLTSSSLKTS
jgi:hypothetical protein